MLFYVYYLVQIIINGLEIVINEDILKSIRATMENKINNIPSDIYGDNIVLINHITIFGISELGRNDTLVNFEIFDDTMGLI